MQVWNALHAARCKYRAQKNRHLGTIAQICRAISSQLRHAWTIGKNLLSSNISSTRPDNMVNFGLLTAENGWEFGAPLQISTGFASWQHYCTHSSTGRQPNFAALNTGRHLYSKGRPSRWALAHISSCVIFARLWCSCPSCLQRVLTRYWYAHVTNVNIYCVTMFVCVHPV